MDRRGVFSGRILSGRVCSGQALEDHRRPGDGVPCHVSQIEAFRRKVRDLESAVRSGPGPVDPQVPPVRALLREQIDPGVLDRPAGLVDHPPRDRRARKQGQPVLGARLRDDLQERRGISGPAHPQGVEPALRGLGDAEPPRVVGARPPP
jgi:hypothetical protein